MRPSIFTYHFRHDVDFDEVQASLVLALTATQGLHGESRVRLEAGHAVDRHRKTCVVDAKSDVGQDLNRLFVTFIRKEFGEDSFRFEQVDCPQGGPGKQETEK